MYFLSIVLMLPLIFTNPIMSIIIIIYGFMSIFRFTSMRYNNDDNNWDNGVSRMRMNRFG